MSGHRESSDETAADRKGGIRQRLATRIAIVSGYVFVCCFLAGPAFGLIAVVVAYTIWVGGDAQFKLVPFAYPFALIFGGVQGFRAGLRPTDFLDRNGYISLQCVVQTTIRIAFTPSTLMAVAFFFRAWAAHDLKGLLLWPAQAFAATGALHALAALGVIIMIFPFMRAPNGRLPAS